jgi:hypothetical protein
MCSGIGVLYTLFDTGMRVYVFSSAKGSAVNMGEQKLLLVVQPPSSRTPQADEWPVYVAVALASVVGFLLGTAGRRWVNSVVMLRVLLVLVFLSSSVLMGALDDWRLATAFVAGAALWTLAIWLTWFRQTWTCSYLAWIKT